MDVSNRARENAFEGCLSHYSAHNGATFGLTRADDTITHFGQPTSDYILLSSTISGSAHLQIENASSVTVSAGTNLVVLDGSRSVSTQTKNHSHVYLTVPTDVVKKHLGFEYRPSANGFSQVPAEGLALFLESQMHLMAQKCAELSEDEAHHLVTSLQSLALGTLAQIQKHPQSADQAEGKAVHAAAARYIALHLGNENLGAESVAAAVQCSRSALFRAFQECGDTVGRHIRRERFDLAKGYLLREPTTPIQIVAHMCGYRTSESFGRFFRDNAGISPTAFRKKHL